MSRSYNIQNRTRDRLKDLNTRVSKKKSRYRRKNGIELNEIIQTKKPDQFRSSKEVKQYIREMERFLDRDTQYVSNDRGVVFNRKTVEKFTKQIERVNQLKEKERKKFERLQTQMKGIALGKTVGEYMEKNRKIFPNLAPLSTSLNRFYSEKELKQSIKNHFEQGFYRGNFIQRADLKYKESFIQSLQTHFGLERSARLRNHIARMNLTDFMSIYYQTVGTIDINYVYDDQDELYNKLKTVERTFGL